MERILPILTLVVILFCVLLRIVPGLVLGVPYLPDPWVHIRKADDILQLGYFDLQGDYDDRWPGINLLIALFASIAGIDTITVARLIVPLIGGLSLLFFYFLIRRVTQNEIIALAAVLLLGFAAPNTLIMGTTYKEGLARVFLMGGLFAFSLRTPAKHEGLLLPVLLFGAILPTHHSTFLIVGSILCFVVFAFLFSQYRKAELTKQQFILQSLGYLSLFVFGIVYFVGVGGFAILLLDAQILAILLSGFFVIFGLLNLWRIRSTAKTPKFLKVVLLFLAIFGILLILANFVNIPTFPLTILPPATLLLLLPIIALGILGGFGLVSLDRVSESEQIFFSSWVYALLGLLVLALIGGLLFQFSLGLVLTYRLFIFLLAPVSALAGVGIFAYYRAHPHRSRIIQVTLVLSLLAVLPVTTVAFTRDPFFGYGCSITPAIQTSNHWLADYSTSGEVIVGDHLFTYYLLHYLERPASIERGIQLYVQNNRTTPFTFAGFHQYMLQNGFWLQTGIQWSPIHTQVPLWLMQAPSTALIYNNGIVQVFRRL